MKIVVAKTAGFCMGVRRAFNSTLKVANESKETINTYGPLIHNPQTISMLNKKGVTEKKNIEDIDAKKVIIRTHGIGLEDKNNLIKKCADVIDLTCPHVTRIQKIIKRHSDKGESLIIFGDENHAEVTGLMGYADLDKVFVIQNSEMIKSLPSDISVSLVSQTTSDIEEFEIIKEEFKNKYPDSKIYNTICNATSKRQEEVIRISKENDAIVVVGGKNSANTQRLKELAGEYCKKVFVIETEEELNSSWFNGIEKVGVTAGASTPSWVLSNVIEAMDKIGERGFFHKLAKGLLRFIIYTDLVLALLGISFVATYYFLLGEKADILHMYAAGSYLLAMYILNHLTNIDINKYDEIFKQDYLLRYKKLSMFIGVVATLSSIVISFLMGTGELIIMALACLGGIVYHINILPPNNIPFLKARSLKDITFSKDLGISISWGIVCVLLPYMGDGLFSLIFLPLTFVYFIFVFFAIFLRTVIHDIRDINRDRVVGKETLPIVLGRKHSRNLARIIWLILFAIPAIATAFGVLSPITGFPLALSLLPLLVIVLRQEKRDLPHTLWFDIQVDFLFFLPLVSVYIANMLK